MSRLIFVYGSNLAGVHAAGAAKCALEKHGARWGVGEGLQGDSYGIPTKDHLIRTRSLEEIQESVDRFIIFAIGNPELTFNVTRIGCGLAGYVDSEIAPMFVGAPANCRLPEGWRELTRKAARR